MHCCRTFDDSDCASCWKKEQLLIATAHLFALLSIGPDLFLIIEASLRLVRYAIGVCAGVTVANALYLLFAVFVWDSGGVIPIGRATVRAWLEKSVVMIEKISGVILTFFGLLFAIT